MRARQPVGPRPRWLTLAQGGLLALVLVAAVALLANGTYLLGLVLLGYVGVRALLLFGWRPRRRADDERVA